MATHPRTDIFDFVAHDQSAFHSTSITAATSSSMTTDSAPIASTSTLSFPSSVSVAAAAPLALPSVATASMSTAESITTDAQARKLRKKKQGRGREMMVKVFYSLNSPRFSSNSPAPTPPPAQVATPTAEMTMTATSFPLDPALASLSATEPINRPTPTPVPSMTSQTPSQQTYTCLARLSAPVWVQLLGTKPTEAELDAGKTEYGKLTLKTCLSAICISRPELVTEPSKDYAVSALDPYESSLAALSTTSSATMSGQGLMEGKGMLSWNLAEKREGTTWVCGRVVADERETRRRSKRRKGEDGKVVAMYTRADDEDEDSSEDEDENSVRETLEVWLQLVERPSFTQMQFLTSLRSFANPAQSYDSSDRASSPPRRREQMLASQAARHVARPGGAAPLGDPVKRKRTRDADRLPLAIPALSRQSSTNSAFPSPTIAPSDSLSSAEPLNPTASKANLDDSRVASLLAQLLPSLTATSGGASTSEQRAPTSLDSDEARQLLPAIRTLAEYYGVEVPMEQSNDASASSSAPVEANGKGRDARPPVSEAAGADRATAKGRKEPLDAFTPIADQAPLVDGAKGRFNPADAAGGCFNCKRKKSTVWRESLRPEGTRVTACNACGAHYNKYGRHRIKGERTSPVRAQDGAIIKTSATTTTTTRRGGRPLTGRLTAACESDLKKVKSKKGGPSTSRGPGMVAPPSPSKVIGPRLSPGTSFGYRGSHTLTSPSRHSASRNRSAHRSGGGSNPFGYPATSPTRASHHHGPIAAGLRSGYESDGAGRGTSANSLASIFGTGNHSPSPDRPSARSMPAYLLTASPGTALDRILNDTNIDLDSFNMAMPDAADSSATIQHGHDALTGDASLLKDTLREHLAALDDDEDEGSLDRALSLYLSSLTPNDNGRDKENERPASVAVAIDGPSPNDPYAMIDPALLPPSHPTSTAFRTDAPTTDVDPFESVLSSLRRDFNTRLSSNALTAPSSPIPSSPCVQPRTSSATPGQKGKAPASCGRPAPSIVDSFLDGLVPALAFNPVPNGDTPLSDSDAWTPASLGQNEDATMTLDAYTSTKAVSITTAEKRGVSGGSLVELTGTMPHHPAAAKHVIPHISTTSDADFDFGSLPPSSPPALPSEAGPTPSEFGSCITPDGDGYLEDSSAGEDATMLLATKITQTASHVEVNKAAGGGSTEESDKAIKALLAGAGDTVQLDRSTLDKLLQLIGKSSSSTSTTPLDDQSGESSSTNKTEQEHGGDEVEKMYANMFA